MTNDTTTPPRQDATRPRGPATRAELEDLHRDLTRHLLAELRKERPAVAYLEVVRKLLDDDSVYPADPATLRRLNRLHKLWTERMTTLLARDAASATAMQEVRFFLQRQKTQGPARAQAGAAEGDPLLSLPFPKGPPQ